MYNHEFILKELLYFRSQARQEVIELRKAEKSNGWRMKSLAQNNLEQANRMIKHLQEQLKNS